MENNNLGQVKISNEVIVTIAGLAALEVENVETITTITDKLLKNNGVKIQIDEEQIILDIYVNIEFGESIPDTAFKIQENVKNTVETMTGLEVSIVNVHVQGITFYKEKAEKEEAKAQKKEEAKLAKAAKKEEARLAKEAKKEYDKSVSIYSSFCDSNQDVELQSYISKRDELENEMQLKFNTYSAMRTQLEAMKAKLQEKTPAYTTLQSASVPIKPAGPKRVIFVFGICFIAMIITAFWLVRKNLFDTPKVKNI